MPIYEYQCESCYKEIEVIQRVNEADKTECPHCHELNLKKKLSLNSFQLKGSGWYKDGYGNAKTSKTVSSKPGATGEKTNKAVA